MADLEHFRTASAFFNQIPWRSDILSEPCGLNKLELVPGVSVSRLNVRLFTVAQLQTAVKAYLNAIRKQEHLLHCSSTYFSGMERVKVLQTFCLTGTVSENQMDTFVKELLKYRLLDIVAFVRGAAPERTTIERGTVPLAEKLVRIAKSARLLIVEKHTSQGHVTMEDWPRVVDTAVRSMKPRASEMQPAAPNAATNIPINRLHACFQAVCHATGSVHKAKITQNFAAAAFHLCYLLQVRTHFYL